MAYLLTVYLLAGDIEAIMRGVFFLIIIVIVSWLSSASAETIDPYAKRLAESSRYGDQSPPFAPNGLDMSLVTGSKDGLLSSMMFYPQLDVRETYDDNVYLTDGNKTSDLITSTRAMLEMRSNWERHGFRAIVNAATNQYADHGDNTNEAFSALMEGSVDISPADRLRPFAQYTDHYIDRYGMFSTPNEPLLHTKETRYGAEYSHDLELPFGLFLKAEHRQIDYMNGPGGASINNDRTISRVEGRVNYNMSPDFGIFIAPAYQSNNFRNSVDSSGLAKNSYISEFMTGASLQKQDLWYFELAVGASRMNFAESTYRDAWASTIRGRFIWTPLDYVSINGNLKREILISDRLTNEEAVITGGDVVMNYAILEELRLKANFAYYHAAFERSGRSDDDMVAGAGIEYRFNPNARVENEYTHRTRSSNLQGYDFDDNLFSVNLRLNM